MELIFSKVSGINDSIYGKSQEPIKMLMEKAVENFERASCLSRIFKEDSTKNFAEKYTSLTAMGNFEPVGENGPYPDTGMQEGFAKVLEPDTWKSRFAITAEMVEDNKLGLISARAKKFTQSYMRTREQFGASLIGGAIAGDPVAFGKGRYAVTGADGKPFFDTAHPSITGGADPQTNKFTGAFSNANLAKLEEKMQNFKDDNGNLLSIAPDTIVIPNIAELKNEVFTAIGADKDPNTANNGFNFTFGRWNVCVWAYLNKYIVGANIPWILTDSNYNEDYAGAVLLDRLALSVKSRIDEETDANIIQGRARFTGGFNDWRAMAVAGVTGGSNLTA